MSFYGRQKPLKTSTQTTISHIHSDCVDVSGCWRMMITCFADAISLIRCGTIFLMDGYMSGVVRKCYLSFRLFLLLLLIE